ncbi:MAG: hypothetical protein Tsb0010_06560 [Parvularculaceae bacterium]
MLGARLAEMHLAVNDAGEHVEPGAVDGFGRKARVYRADLRDTATLHCDVARALAVMIDDGSVFENQIE